MQTIEPANHARSTQAGISQTPVKKLKTTAAIAIQTSRIEEVKHGGSKGNYELQKKIAMLNKLCVYYLNRATSKGQTTEQTRV